MKCPVKCGILSVIVVCIKTFVFVGPYDYYQWLHVFNTRPFRISISLSLSYVRVVAHIVNIRLFGISISLSFSLFHVRVVVPSHT